MADPERSAELLEHWRSSHPTTLTGVIWFRLPTAQDTLAWHPDTLTTVRDGHPLHAAGETEFELAESGARDVCLTSTGTLPWTPSPIVLTDASLAREVLADPEQMAVAATLPLAAAITSIALTSDHRFRDADVQRAELEGWLDALSPDQGHEMAGRLAWAAYQRGDGTLAAAWVGRADGDDGMALWIGAKLALERGELDVAARDLESALDVFSAGHGPGTAHCEHGLSGAEQSLHAELGIVRIAQDRPAEAMVHFLNAGAWSDAAWVGERLLTVDELAAVVRLRAPDRLDAAHGEAWSSGFLPILHDRQIEPSLEPVLLRPLLGRRLVRDGRMAEARDYLPPEARSYIDQVIADLAISNDQDRSDADRGGALWRVAFTLKMQGWALSATELEPDHRILGGWYPGRDVARSRHEPVTPPADALAAPTDEERRRIDESAVPNNRYHFVWTATDLASEALERMPDGHPDLAQAACVTAKWMRNRDPHRSALAMRQVNSRAPEHPLALWGNQGLDDDGWCVPRDGPKTEVGCKTSGGMAGLLLLFPALFRRARAWRSGAT